MARACPVHCQGRRRLWEPQALTSEAVVLPLPCSFSQAVPSRYRCFSFVKGINNSVLSVKFNILLQKLILWLQKSARLQERRLLGDVSSVCGALSAVRRQRDGQGAMPRLGPARTLYFACH